jgi:YD repeat-containing protein
MILRQGFARDLPHHTQKFDYGVRTDGQPDYYGVAKNEYGDTDPKWVIHRYTYNGSGFVTAIVSKEGAWSARAVLLP